MLDNPRRTYADRLRQLNSHRATIARWHLRGLLTDAEYTEQYANLARAHDIILFAFHSEGRAMNAAAR